MENIYTLTNNHQEMERLSKQAKYLYGGMKYLSPYLKTGMNIIDVGCGTGTAAAFMAKNAIGGSVIAIDTDEAKIRANSNRYTIENLKFRRGDVLNIPYDNNAFDLTTARFVLMHLNQPIDAIKEMIRVTKHGGTIVIHEGIHDAIWLIPEIDCFKLVLSAWKRVMTNCGQNDSIGLHLYNILAEQGLSDVNYQVIPHVAHYGDPLFDMYIENWRRHLPSLKNSIKPHVGKGVLSKMDECLNNLNEHSSYIEMTAIASGVKL